MAGVRCAVVKRRNATIGRELRSPRLDILGDFGQGRARVGGRKFQAVILRGIVAGSEVDGAVELAVQDFEGDGGRGSEGLAQQRANAVVLQDVHGKLGEFFGVEARVVTHQNRGIFHFGFCVFGDGGNRQAHIGEGEIVGDEAAPSGGAKLNGGGRHEAVF